MGNELGQNGRGRLHATQQLYTHACLQKKSRIHCFVCSAFRVSDYRHEVSICISFLAPDGPAKGHFTYSGFIGRRMRCLWAGHELEHWLAHHHSGFPHLCGGHCW
jgi:hypothetical protein